MSGLSKRSGASTALIAAAALAAGLAAPPAARALTITPLDSPDSLHLAIPDDGYDGTLGSMASSTITVGALAEPVVTDVNIVVSLDHTFAGDLTIKLRSPLGTIITLLNRPGLLTTDDGSQTGGDSSNFEAGFSIVFDDTATADAEDMGQGLLDDDIIGDTPVNSSPAVYFPDADGAAGDLLKTFHGENGVGVWTLYLGDSAAGETGSLQQWSLLLQTVVPEPATGLLLASAGLIAMRRPRRRRGQ
jgi:subtilisin-like proprotein convertase family protein